MQIVYNRVPSRPQITILVYASANDERLCGVAELTEVLLDVCGNWLALVAHRREGIYADSGEGVAIELVEYPMHKRLRL